MTRSSLTTSVWAAALAGVCAVALAPPAEAARRPTATERTKIIRAVGARKCEVGRIRVSTVDSRWALFEFGFARGADAQSCPNVPTGRVFVRRRSGRWRSAASGSDITCDQAGLPSRRVQADLRTRCRVE